MLIRKLHDCEEIIAGDGTRLRELFHPGRDYRFSGRYSLARAVVAPGQASIKHRLAASEVYYIVAGKGRMRVDDEQVDVAAGDAVDIPPGCVQWIENTGESDLMFLCIVDPAWRADDEEVLG
ncbi:MAG TPA: cupin domain-containing protein [Acidobacteriota bacterium]|nr:cupin domain-containing protein [Acidobacteriota bacterium]